MSKLLDRLEQGPVICAEGYLFEFERRGYLQAGAFVPEVVLEHPELVAQLHREFVHAGSDVVEAFTYYAHREKLRLIGKEDALEEINRQALQIATDVARESDALLAGDICNTNVYDSGDPESAATVRAMFEEQVGWAVDAGVDFVIGETFSWGEEALIALDVISETGLPAVITLAIHRAPETREGWTPGDACRRFEDAGAAVVGLNCIRGPQHDAAAARARSARLRRATSPRCRCRTGRPTPSRPSSRSPTPTATASPATVRSRPRSTRSSATATSSPSSPGPPRTSASPTSASAAAPRRTTSAASPRRSGARRRQPLQRGHEPPRVPRLRGEPQDRQPGLRREL